MTGKHLVKRLLQKEILFPAVETNGLHVTGLAGWDPNDCLINYKEGFRTEKVTLVDIEVKQESFVLRMPIESMPATPIMDCDYCRSAKHMHCSFFQVYDHMKQLPKDVEKAILFCFSVRGYKITNYKTRITYSESMKEMETFTLRMLNSTIYQNSLSDLSRESCEVFEDNRDLINAYNYENNMLPSTAHIIKHKQSVFDKSIILRYKETCEMLAGIVTWH